MNPCTAPPTPAGRCSSSPTSPIPGIFVFTDAHHPLTDPITLRAVKDAAQRADTGQTILLAAPRPLMPPELESLAVPWTLRPPDRSELAAMVRRTVEDLAATRTGVHLAGGRRVAPSSTPSPG